jgi:hypothetical protein
MTNKTTKKEHLGPHHPLADISDSLVREVRAETMGLSKYEYEKVLRAIGVDYSKREH